jgi:hypothetical protein
MSQEHYVTELPDVAISLTMIELNLIAMKASIHTKFSCLF